MGDAGGGSDGDDSGNDDLSGDGVAGGDDGRKSAKKMIR